MIAATPVSMTHVRSRAFRNKVIQGLALLAVVITLLVFAPVWFVMATIGILGLICLVEITTTNVVTDFLWDDASAREIVARFGMIIITVCGSLMACKLYASESQQMLLVFYACFVGVTVTDGAAQLSGVFWYRVFGQRTSMAFGLIRPFKITSPKKTIIGFIGGVLLGGVAVIIVNLVAGGGLPWWFTVAIPVCAVGGDLIASYAKRKIGTKDFGIYTRKPLLGEHGGVLDRGDGHWFTFIVIGVLSFMFM